MSGAPPPLVLTIAFYNHTGDVGGGEQVLLSLLRQLDRTRFAPVVLCPEGPLAVQVRALGVPHRPVPALAARFSANPFAMAAAGLGVLPSLGRLRSALRKAKPALVHANSIRAGMAATLALARTDVPVLWHLHDMLPESVVGRAIRRLGASSRVRLLAVSHAVARNFALGSKLRRPIEVIHNSVDSDLFKTDADARKRLREELSITTDDVAFVTVAQFTPRKRQLELVGTFAATRDQLPHARLFLVGGAYFNDANREYFAQVQAEVARLQDARIRMLGHREDIAGLLNGMDVAVQTPLEEPLGLSLLEAMATGIPVLSTAVGGIVEVVDDGVTGLLCERDDWNALHAHLRTLAADGDLRREMGTRGREVAATRFSPAEQMLRMHAIYGEMTQGSDVQR